MIRVDRSGRAVDWNAAAARMLAPALKLVEGAVVADAFVVGAAFEDAFTRCLAGEQLTRERLEVDSYDGRGGPVQVTVAPLHDGAGSAVGCTLVFEDLREQIASQRALAEGERRVRRAEMLAMIGTFVVDCEDGSEQWSDGMYRIHGVNPAEFATTLPNHIALIAEKDRSAFATLIARTLSGALSPGLELRVECDGIECAIVVTVEPRIGSDGQIVGLSGVCQDINSRVETEAALHRALLAEQAVNEELRKLDSLKDEFLATVSHELRTPLTAIAGYAELLEDVAPESTGLIEPITRNAHDMQDLVEELLHEARLEAGRITIEPTRFGIAAMVREFLSDKADRFAKLRMVVDMDDDLSIEMDQEAFCLVLGNLVGNAAKYAPQGTVTISAASTSAGITVSVADEGEGIPAEYVERVFEPFFRSPGADRSAGGSGFGLSIVRRYVELHGGTARCESVLGRGSTFSFTLPMSQTHQP